MTTTIPPGFRADRVSIDAADLTIRQRWESGSTHDIHVRANDGLSVHLSKASVSIGSNEGGLMILGLNVDGEGFDVIEYESAVGRFSIEDRIEMFTQAGESLLETADALRRLQKA